MEERRQILLLNAPPAWNLEPQTQPTVDQAADVHPWPERKRC
jgi:hypothetical protein